jgi:hypothetical protein
MGSIKVETKKKNGKEYRYFHYRITRRSRLRDGGDGQPKTIDKLIGDRLTGQYLAFWLWDGLPAVDYIEAMVGYELKPRNNYDKYYLSRIRWQIDWQFKKGKAIAAKLKFRSVTVDGFKIDARDSYFKHVKYSLKWMIDSVLERKNNCSITREVKRAAFYLALYESKKNRLAGYEKQHSQWQKDFRKGKADRDDGDRLMERMEESRYEVNEKWEEYQSIITKLLDMAPPKQRERFKATIIRQAEKLAASPNYIANYEP